MDLPSIKYITQAGGKLSNSIIKEFANQCLNKNIDFFVMYGQTEGTSRLSYLNPDKILEDADTFLFLMQILSFIPITIP